MTADHHDGPLHVAQRPEQFNGDLLAGRDAFREPGDRDHAVSFHERRDDARPSLHRRRDDSAPDLPEPHPQQLILPHRRRHVARQDRFRLGPRQRLQPQPDLDQRLHEQLARQRGRHRIPGNAEHRLAVDHAQHNRMPGPERHAVHQQVAKVAYHVCGVVLRSGRRSRIHDHDVVLSDRIRHRRSHGIPVVRDRRQPRGLASPLAHHARDHEAVVLNNVPGLQFRAGLNELRAGGDDCQGRSLANRHGGDPGRRARAEVHRPYAVVLRQDKLRRYDVLPERPHMLVRRSRCQDLDCGVVNLVHHLHHDHGIEAGRHRVARVHPHDLSVHRKSEGRRLGRSGGLPRSHRDTVHRRRVVVRGRRLRPHRLCCHPPERFLQCHVFRSSPAHCAAGIQRRVKSANRLLHRYVAQEVPAPVPARADVTFSQRQPTDGACNRSPRYG